MNEIRNVAAPTSGQRSSDGAALPVKIDTLLDMRSPGSMDITADGKRVAFVVWEAVPGEQNRRGRIWTANTEGGDARPFTSGKRNELFPRWSPDGKQLAYVTAPEGEKEKPQLHLIAAEGGEPRLVCKMPNGVNTIAWAPDGSRIAFLSLEGEKPKSDPKVLAPARHRRLWVIRPDQAIPEPVTPADVTVREYVWSPDSKKFALYYSNGPEDTDWYHSEVGAVASDGGAVQQLSNLSGQARGLTWSPDAKQVAYLSGRWSDPGRGSGDIFAVSLESRETRNLTPGIASSPAWVCWMPDGRSLLYAAVKGVTQQIALLDIHTGVSRVLEEDFVMLWDQPRLAITPDCRNFATVHSSSHQPNDVWFGTLSGEAERPDGIKWSRLTRLNPLIEETLPLAKAERINYESVDGWRIDGLFIAPTFQKPGELPPLYVDVHGGPSGTDCDSWRADDQIFAAAGYAIFHPNMRGSWGHGAAFADAVLGDMGGKDFQDILHGVEYLVQQERVDGNRLCIGGWSNGGFLSAWAVTQTNRFKAAMVGAGIMDWLNMHAQTTIPDADVLLLAADPLEQPEVYMRHSPMTYAARVTTPTLILHGEEDPFCPIAQAYAFYRALRERKVPVECVIYPRAGHGVSERDHMRDSIERQLRWFEKYVL